MIIMQYFLKCRSVTNFTEGTTSTSTSLRSLSLSSTSSSRTSSSTMSFSHIPLTSLRMEIFTRIKSFQRWANAPFTSKYFIHKKIPTIYLRTILGMDRLGLWWLWIFCVSFHSTSWTRRFISDSLFGNSWYQQNYWRRHF